MKPVVVFGRNQMKRVVVLANRMKRVDVPEPLPAYATDPDMTDMTPETAHQKPLAPRSGTLLFFLRLVHGQLSQTPICTNANIL